MQNVTSQPMDVVVALVPDARLPARVVETPGGTIRAESTPGEGTSFIVKLPLEPPAKLQFLQFNC